MRVYFKPFLFLTIIYELFMFNNVSAMPRTVPEGARILQLDHDHNMTTASVFGSSTLGYYYSFVEVGTPPQRATVILDTGSGLTAFPCKNCDSCGVHMDPLFDPEASSSAEFVGCSSSTCSGQYTCKNTLCTYYQGYSEGSSISGSLLHDVMWLGRGDRNERFGIDYTFGCHSKETHLFRTQYVDGIMGLDMNADALPGQLKAKGLINKHVFSLCLARAGGQFTIGGVNESVLKNGSSTWATIPLRRENGGSFYVVKLVEIDVVKPGDMEGQPIGLSPSVFSQLHNVIIDSGTTFTYMASSAADKLLTQVKQACDQAGHNCRTSNMPGENFCMAADSSRGYGDRITRTPPSYITELLPTIILHFEQASVSVPPSQYLHSYYPMMDGSDGGPPSDATDQWGRYWCFGIYSTGSRTIIGANLMQDYAIVFDVDEQEIRIAPANCHLSSACEGCTVTTNQHDSNGFMEHPFLLALCIAGILVLIVVVVRRRKHDAYSPLAEPSNSAVPINVTVEPTLTSASTSRESVIRNPHATDASISGISTTIHEPFHDNVMFPPNAIESDKQMTELHETSDTHADVTMSEDDRVSLDSTSSFDIEGHNDSIRHHR